MKSSNDSFAILPKIKFSVEQHFYSISDIENGIVSSNVPKLDYCDDNGVDDDDYDDLCRNTYEADAAFEQSIIDEKNEQLNE